MKRFLLCLPLLLASTTTLADKSAGEMVDDTWLHTKVKTELVGYGSANINIEVYHGHVQLAAFVATDVEKQAILDQVHAMDDVVEVHDQLFVVDRDRSAGERLDDGVTASKVKAALADSDLGRGFNVNVEVNKGTVLLSGWVDDKDERGTALTVAETVDTVVEVLNGMDLKPAD